MIFLVLVIHKNFIIESTNEKKIQMKEGKILEVKYFFFPLFMEHETL
jgi:hypothetical protein